VDVDLEGIFPIQGGDTFLLCSDGLTGQVADREIGGFLLSLPTPEAAALLVDVANLRGGPDNVTVILVRIPEDVPWDQGESTDVTSEPRTPFPTEAILYWTGAALSLGGTAALFLKQLWIAAGVAALATGALGMIALHKSQLGRVSARSRGGALGNGPHSVWDVAPDKSLTDSLATLGEKLESAAREQGIEVDWAGVLEMRNIAKTSAAEERFEDAVREWAKLIRTVMSRLRRLDGNSAADAVVG
jgi:protein phosphatase